MQWVTATDFGASSASRIPTTVVSVEFITNDEAQNRLHGELTGLPASAPVCYVRIHGDFLLYGPPGVGVESMMVHDGYLLFDAQTGNLLMSNV